MLQSDACNKPLKSLPGSLSWAARLLLYLLHSNWSTGCVNFYIIIYTKYTLRDINLCYIDNMYIFWVFMLSDTYYISKLHVRSDYMVWRIVTVLNQIKICIFQLPFYLPLLTWWLMIINRNNINILYLMSSNWNHYDVQLRAKDPAGPESECPSVRSLCHIHSKPGHSGRLPDTGTLLQFRALQLWHQYFNEFCLALAIINGLMDLYWPTNLTKPPASKVLWRGQASNL